jgi:hypothetical protein
LVDEEEQDENINRESDMGTKKKKKKKLQLQEGGREGYERMILDDSSASLASGVSGC